MYMFAEDGVGPPGCRSARPRRLFPVRALGLNAGLRRRFPPPQPPPLPAQGPLTPHANKMAADPPRPVLARTIQLHLEGELQSSECAPVPPKKRHHVEQREFPFPDLLKCLGCLLEGAA